MLFTALIEGSIGWQSRDGSRYWANKVTMFLFPVFLNWVSKLGVIDLPSIGSLTVMYSSLNLMEPSILEGFLHCGAKQQDRLARFSNRTISLLAVPSARMLSGSGFGGSKTIGKGCRMRRGFCRWQFRPAEGISMRLFRSATILRFEGRFHPRGLC